LSQVNSSFLTCFSRPRSRDRGLTGGDDSWCRGQVLTRQLTVVAERWGDRCGGRGRATSTGRERERDVLLWLGPWRGSMRRRRISGRIYTLIVAENKITALLFCMLPERVEQSGEMWGNLFAICFFFYILFAICFVCRCFTFIQRDASCAAAMWCYMLCCVLCLWKFLHHNT
jgi:hypothetical protein